MRNKITICALTAFALVSVSSCTFYGEMKNRRAENIELQKQYAAETARTEALQAEALRKR
jgi:hypothetical protein